MQKRARSFFAPSPFPVPDGTYILAMATHVVAVVDGDWLDTWDSGDETPLYYWQKG